MIKKSDFEYPEESTVRMISRSGKRTIFLFTNTQRRLIQDETNKMNSEKELYLKQQNFNIQKYLQKKNDLLIHSKKNPKTFVFRTVSREKLAKRVKSNSPKNDGEFYKVHYEIIDKKIPFFAKLKKPNNGKKTKMNFLKNTSFRNETQVDNINSEEKIENLNEFINKPNKNLVNFEKQLERKELFQDFIKHQVHDQSYDIEKYSKNTPLNINFKKYVSRKEIFPGVISTHKDYDKSPEIYEKFKLNNTSFNCLINYDKCQDRKLFNDEKHLKVRKIETPSDFNLYQGFCKTHKVYSQNLGCYSPKVGRERPSPIQDRILKENEKMGFDCFNKKEVDEIENEKMRKPQKKTKKFNLKTFVKEVEREIKRESKSKKKRKIVEEETKLDKTL